MSWKMSLPIIKIVNYVLEDAKSKCGRRYVVGVITKLVAAAVSTIAGVLTILGYGCN